MSRGLVNLLLGAFALLGVSTASASLLGHSTSLTMGGTLISTPAADSATVGGGVEYDVCVGGPAGCATGLRLQIDIGASNVAFTLSGTAGGPTDNFNLTIAFNDFVAPEAINDVTPNKQSFPNQGEFVVDNTGMFDFISFHANTDGSTPLGAGRGVTLTFDIDFTGGSAAIPEPAPIALLAVALAAIMVVRRRPLRLVH